jgi:hypothetical protein
VRAYLARRTDQPLGPAARAFREALLRRADGSATPTSQEREAAMPGKRRQPGPRGMV